MRTRPVLWLGVLTFAGTAACSSFGSPPTAPTTPPTAPAALTYPNFTLSGVVTDSTSGLPIEGVLAHATYASPPGSPTATDVNARWSDVAGVYRITGLPLLSGTAWIQASKITGPPPFDYFQQCAVSIPLDGSTTTLNIQITREADLSSFAAPTSTPRNTRIVRGIVFRTVDGAQRPIPGAFVDFEAGLDFLGAWTKTDRAGHYLLCGLPTTRFELGAWSNSSNAKYLTVDSGSDAVVDVELN